MLRSKRFGIAAVAVTGMIFAMMVPPAPATASSAAPAGAAAPPAPSPRYNIGMAYDATHGQVVLFGGWGDSGDLDDTWTWDGTGWTKRKPAASPPARCSMGMAYDAARGEVVLFGGIRQRTSSTTPGPGTARTGPSGSPLIDPSCAGYRAWPTTRPGARSCCSGVPTGD